MPRHTSARWLLLLLPAVLATCGPSRSAHAPLATRSPATPPVAATAAVIDPAPPGFRLPAGVRPTRGHLELTIHPDRETLDGIARYDISVDATVPAVWLHASGLVVARAAIDGGPARIVFDGTDVIGVVPATPLAAGAHTVELHYRGAIDHERSRGVYADKEGDAWYAYTFFEPIDARRAFPCFDEPGFKIPWELVFHVKREHVALGNAPVTAETDEPDGMKRVALATTKPLPSYLVAFVVGPFELVDGGVAGRARTPVRFIVPQGRAAETRYAREVTPRVVTLLEDYFDMPYPYEKLDVAVVPRYWGTMEHPGIVAMGQPLTLIPPAQETTRRKTSYANILTHELAHYWFGDVVTMAWWDDTWLNESLASWLDINITDQVEPAWHYADRRVAMASGAMGSDELLAARAMRATVTTSEEIDASFDNGTTYAKGAAVLNMMEQWVGPEKFQAFIRAYIHAHAWGTATADDFLAALEANAGPDAVRVFRSFLEQPGVPLVTVDVRCTGKKASLRASQRRSMPQGVVPSAPALWSVPVCVRDGQRPAAERHCILLEAADAEVELPGGCPRALVANTNADGYYRTSARGRVATTATPGLTRRERIGMIENAVAGYERGEVEVAELFASSLRMRDDRDAHVARRALAALWSVSPWQLELADRDAFDRMLVTELAPRARKLGWQRQPGDDENLHTLRLELLNATAANDLRLRATAVTLTRIYLSDPLGVPDDVAGIALWAAATHGNRDTFDAVLDAARRTTDRRTRGRLLSALSAFRDPAIAGAARALVLDADLDVRETIAILYGQLSTQETRADAWAWTREHLLELLPRMRSDDAGTVLAAVASTYCDRAHRDEADAWLTPVAAKIDGAAHALRQSLEGVDRCIERQARDRPSLRRFLSRY